MSVQKSSSSVIAVVGPTATGKTALAVQLAQAALDEGKWRGVSVISVDSRQVYKGLEICSGVDIPPEWKATIHDDIATYQHPTLPVFLFGTSVITPDQEWSVAHFRALAWQVMTQAFAQNELVICVGGTGLYHEHLFSTHPVIGVGPNQDLREQVAQLDLEALQNRVQFDAGQIWEQMNHSDRYNPRRLVRALEKKAALESSESADTSPLPLPFTIETQYTLGITDEIAQIEKRIHARVNERITQGAITEVQKLMGQYGKQAWKLPAFSSTGCKEVRAYIENMVEYDEMIMLWVRREVRYAKRQLTWWRKHQYATEVSTFGRKQSAWYHLAEQKDDDWQTAAVKSCILLL